jgi:hypothetical protein
VLNVEVEPEFRPDAKKCIEMKKMGAATAPTATGGS